VHVANLAHRTAVAAGVRLIGQVLTLKTDGTGEATEESLVTLESAINSDLEQTLLRNARGEGARASGASVTFARDTDLSEPGATLPGVVSLIVNGVIEQIAFTIRVS
jgi:hypothetical protein